MVAILYEPQPDLCSQLQFLQSCQSFREIYTQMFVAIWRFMHRASSYNMYMNQQDAQKISCD